MTLNIAWLQESHCPSTPLCPGAGVSPHTPTPTQLQPFAGHGHEQEGAPTARGGTAECQRSSTLRVHYSQQLISSLREMSARCKSSSSFPPFGFLVSDLFPCMCPMTSAQ